MSLHQLAQQVRDKGRGDDTELVHFTKGELGGLNALARAMYGSDLPRNPYTGLPEASWLKNLLPTLVGAATTYFTGSDVAGAAAGAAVGGYQANRAGGDTLAGALAGGLGGYGGGQLASGLNAAGASVDTPAAAPVAGPAEGVDATGGPETATNYKGAPVLKPAGAPEFSWEHMKAGIGALGTADGRTAFVGTAAEKGKPATGAGGAPYAALLKAATPLLAPPSASSSSGAPPKREAQKYEGQWVMRDGQPFFETKNVTHGHAEGGAVNTSKGVTSQNVFDYLMGDASLFKPQVTPQAIPAARTTVGGVGVPLNSAGDASTGTGSTGGGDTGPGGAGGSGGTSTSAGDTGAPSGVSSAVGQGIGAAVGTVAGIGPTAGAAIGGGLAGLSQDAAANAPNSAVNSPTAGIAVAPADAAAAANAPSGVAPVSPEAQASIEGMISADAAASAADSGDAAAAGDAAAGAGGGSGADAGGTGAPGTGSSSGDSATSGDTGSGGGGGGGGGCYVTEAMSRAGKSDNAVELGVMRDFRDNVMLKDPKLAKLVQKYYETAPSVVATINQREDAPEIYDLMRERYLKPGVQQVMDGDTKGALKTYADMLSFMAPLARTPVGDKLATGAEKVSDTLGQKGSVALQSGGFVFPADVVSAVGAGSSNAGLEALAKHYGAQPIAGQGHGQSDDIPATIDGQQPARVARDEAVLDADQVARIGGGDSKRGAKKLYDVMARVRKQSMGTTRQMRPVNLKELA